MKLTTARLTIRPFQPEDVEDVHEYCAQPGVGENAGWPTHESMHQTSQILTDWIAAGYKHAIIWRENGKVIGHIAINPDSEENRTDTCELGCALNRDYQRRGVMTEVIKATVEYLFQNGVEYVWACCFQSNIPSRKMIEKCGFIFQQEGTYFSEGLHRTFPSYEYRVSKRDQFYNGNS